MAKYRVYFTAVAETWVEVEADDEYDAVDVAYDKVSYPYFPGGMRGDIGQWEASEEVEALD